MRTRYIVLGYISFFLLGVGITILAVFLWNKFRPKKSTVLKAEHSECAECTQGCVECNKKCENVVDFEHFLKSNIAGSISSFISIALDPRDQKLQDITHILDKLREKFKCLNEQTGDTEKMEIIPIIQEFANAVNEQISVLVRNGEKPDTFHKFHRLLGKLLMTLQHKQTAKLLENCGILQLLDDINRGLTPN